MGYFIDRESYLIDIAGAIDFVEKFQYVEIDKIKDIVNEALETKALYKKKAMDLEKERAAAMAQYEDIIIEWLCFACLLLIVQEQVKEGASPSKSYFKKV